MCTFIEKKHDSLKKMRGWGWGGFNRTFLTEAGILEPTVYFGMAQVVLLAGEGYSLYTFMWMVPVYFRISSSMRHFPMIFRIFFKMSSKF